MYIVAIAWIYVALLMAVAEAFHPTGSIVGAIFTFLLYGVGPVALVTYILGSGDRRRTSRAREQQGSIQPDAGGHAATDTVTPERKIP